MCAQKCIYHISLNLHLPYMSYIFPVLYCCAVAVGVCSWINAHICIYQICLTFCPLSCPVFLCCCYVCLFVDVCTHLHLPYMSYRLPSRVRLRRVQCCCAVAVGVCSWIDAQIYIFNACHAFSIYELMHIYAFLINFMCCCVVAAVFIVR